MTYGWNSSITRSTPISGTTFNTSNSFNVIADVNHGGNWSTEVNNETVSYSTANNIWQTSATHYWPGLGSMVNFYAYYPTSISGSITHNAGSAPVLSYTVPDNAADQIDILASSKTGVAGDSYNQTPVDFKHVFAAVNFQVGTNGLPSGTITGVTLNNIQYKGTYSLNGTWAPNTTDKKSFSQAVSVPTSTGTAITSGATTFIMMPQTLGSDASITVTYSNGGTLTKAITGTWEAGKTYNYDLSYPPRTFDYTGTVQSYTVPVTGIYKLEIWGAQGGSGGYGGGLGGYSYGNIKLNQGSILYIYIGGAGESYNGNSGGNGGYNGGGNGGNGSIDKIAYGGSGGGGATHIASVLGLLSTLSSNTSAIYIVAGGGGGSSTVFENLANGSAGGGVNGGSATADDYSHSINGGSQESGYAFGIGQQGASKLVWEGAGAEGNGGGGGGWYGGYAYQGIGINSCCYGAGGSGHLGSTLISGTTGMQNGARSGNGYARITFISAN